MRMPLRSSASSAVDVPPFSTPIICTGAKISTGCGTDGVGSFLKFDFVVVPKAEIGISEGLHRLVSIRVVAAATVHPRFLPLMVRRPGAMVLIWGDFYWNSEFEESEAALPKGDSAIAFNPQRKLR
jgi:hypothetical protein